MTVRSRFPGWRMTGFGHDRRGVTAVVVALALPVMMMLVGLAIDVGQATSAKSRLDLAADAAVMTAVMTATNEYNANNANYLTDAQTAGIARFNAQAGATANLSTPVASVAVTVSGTTMTATASWTTTYSTILAQIAGVRTIPMAGHSTIQTSLTGSYTNVNFLIDTSASMAMPDTQAGMTLMGQLAAASPYYTTYAQSQACNLACHWSSTNADFYGIARTNNIELRIDAVKTAIADVFTTMEQNDGNTQFSTAVYTFAMSLSTLVATTTNLTSAATTTAAYELPTNTNNPGQTDYPAVFSSLDTTIPASGNGSTAAKARQILFVLTDGVTDYTSGSTRYQQVFNSGLCSTLKAQGVTIAVIYTTYYPMPTNSWYMTYINPFINEIPSALEACASNSSLYAEATDGPSLETAVASMFQQLLTKPAFFTN